MKYYTTDELSFISRIGDWAGIATVNRVRRAFGLEPIDRGHLISLYIGASERREWGDIDGALCVERAKQLQASVRLKGAA